MRIASRCRFGVRCDLSKRVSLLRCPLNAIDFVIGHRVFLDPSVLNPPVENCFLPENQGAMEYQAQMEYGGSCVQVGIERFLTSDGQECPSNPRRAGVPVKSETGRSARPTFVKCQTCHNSSYSPFGASPSFLLTVILRSSEYISAIVEMSWGDRRVSPNVT